MITRITTDRIVSAFQNCIDQDKLEEYTIEMQTKMLSHDFPPIMGFESVIDEDDVECEMEFLNGETVTEEHIGQTIWKVTDGHHRSLAAIEAQLPYLETEEDYSTRT